MGSRRTLLVWTGLGLVALATSGALAFTLMRLGDVSDQAEDLKARLAQMRARVAAIEEKPGVATFDWRALARRVERLEQPGAATVHTAAAARVAGPFGRGLVRTAATLDVPAGELPPSLPTSLLAAEPFRNGLQEMLKTGVKKTLEERRAKWYKKFDDRLQSEIAAFSKSQSLSETQTQSMTAIIQDDRDQRREIRRQLHDGELDNPTAKKQVDTLNANTKGRIVESVGEAGYDAYQKEKQEQRQTRKSLRSF